ncbi:MAG: CRISPR-associated endonuclease Cas2 [Candidatus Berkelbacteria bacterium]|nr:CRISPR-associated endonuclease Cas2 [Candidatus Berkelbacteria bacterium]
MPGTKIIKKKRIYTIRLNEDQKEIFKEYAVVALKYAAVGTLIAVAMTSPNAWQALKPLFRKSRRNFSEKDLDKFNNKIFKDRLIEIVEKNGKEYLKITNKGRKRLIEYNIDTISICQQDWDGKWRIVIFDVPEKYRLARRVLRDKLREIGFLRLQKSVWASPYECENEINFIASIYQIEQYVNYIVAEKIDNNEALKEKFNLI